MTSKYTLRATRWSDRDSLGRLYVSAFSSANDNIIPVIFPSSSTDAVRLRSILSRIFEKRLFSPLDYVFKSVVRTSTGEVVGFSCVKPPTCSVTFYQRWLSPCTSPFHPFTLSPFHPFLHLSGSCTNSFAFSNVASFLHERIHCRARLPHVHSKP